MAHAAKRARQSNVKDKIRVRRIFLPDNFMPKPFVFGCFEKTLFSVNNLIYRESGEKASGKKCFLFGNIGRKDTGPGSFRAEAFEGDLPSASLICKPGRPVPILVHPRFF